MRAATVQQLLEQGLKTFVDLREGVLQTLARLAVKLRNTLAQFGDGRGEVVLFFLQRVDLCLYRLGLGIGTQIDGADLRARAYSAQGLLPVPDAAGIASPCLISAIAANSSGPHPSFSAMRSRKVLKCSAAACTAPSARTRASRASVETFVALDLLFDAGQFLFGCDQLVGSIFAHGLGGGELCHQLPARGFDFRRATAQLLKMAGNFRDARGKFFDLLFGVCQCAPPMRRNPP